MSILSDAQAYIADAFGPTYDTWIALDDTTQQKTLNSAARYFNVLPWQGTQTGELGADPASLVWPRTGVTVDGVAVDPNTTPTAVSQGQYEMAVMINADPTLPGKLDQGSNIQAANAGGGTGVTFFAPTTTRAGTATVIPVIVQRLVAKYLAQPPDVEGGWAGVGKCTSGWAAQKQYTLVRGEE